MHIKKKERAKIVVERLDEFYPGLDKCYLNFNQPYELLFATILSAQCTDDRVNIVTEVLFKKYKCLDDYANAPIEEIESYVKSTGFFRNKAKGIKESAIMLLENHNGELPSDIESLTKLSGVGRKTANVVRSHIFKIESVVVDTHVKRISNKLGLTKESDPVKIEFDLMKVLPKDTWIRYNQQVIAHGRKVCTARSPKCDICGFFDICVSKK
ncbi:MAG: endonuclease III [Lachnospirales bacterium]